MWWSRRCAEVTLLGNVALALEYEATCQLSEHCLAAKLDLHEVGVFVDAMAGTCGAG
jgi:hypothetical protein